MSASRSVNTYVSPYLSSKADKSYSAQDEYTNGHASSDSNYHTT